jgi:hypothetical protein
VVQIGHVLLLASHQGLCGFTQRLVKLFHLHQKHYTNNPQSRRAVGLECRESRMETGDKDEKYD